MYLNFSLQTCQLETDFPLNAPIVFDIVHPHLGKLQRITCRVRSTSQELASVQTELSSQKT
jgi:hypothetical protein